VDLRISAVRTALNVTSRVAPELAGRLAFRLFVRLRPPAQVRASERDVHGAAQVEHLRHDGRRVVVYRWGNGLDPVLLVHGWESRGSRFAVLVQELLSRGLSPITFDAPGNGDSEGNRTTLLEYADIIEELSEKHGAFRAVVSHSLGTLASFVALRRGVGADRVITLNGVSDFGYLTEGFVRELRLAPRIHHLLNGHFETLFPDESDVWERFSVAHEPERVTVPMLVVHDEDDRRVPMGQAEKIAAAYPQARLERTKRLGHNRILADEATARLVADFITQQ
jgi:pimeloyl-ACP methyl ester carboxylesterase